MELDENVLRRFEERGKYLLPEELVSLAERYHEGPGIPRELVTDYARALSDELGREFDADGFDQQVDERLTDADSWEDAEPETLFDIGDGRISRYPRTWHDRFGGSSDPAEYLRYVRDEDPNFARTAGAAGAGEGVSEEALLNAIAAVGKVDHSEAKRRLEDLRADGTVVEDADQHPDSGVYLAEDTEEMRDPDL